MPDVADGDRGEPGEVDGAGEGGPDIAKQPQAADPREVDRTSPWIYFWGGTLLVAAVTAFMWHLHQITPPTNPTETGVRAEIWLFLALPGVSMAVLGGYLFWKIRDGWLPYRLHRSDHLLTLVQLLPGTALAAAGNILPPEHELVDSWPVSPSWASLGLGTLVSLLLVRKFGKAPAATSE